MEIADWRKKIDSLDEQKLFVCFQNVQLRLSRLARSSAANSAPIYEPKREQQVYEHVRAVNAGPLTPAEVQDIFERIMDVMRALQRPPQ